MEKLEGLDWQQVSYRGKLLDRQKAIYSLLSSDYHDFDGISAHDVKDMPEIIEKYRTICQKEEKTCKLNHCVVTLLPKTSNMILPKEEDLEHLQDNSRVYFLTFGYDCPIELVHKMSSSKEKLKESVMKSGDLLILGQGLLREVKLGFPGRVLSGDKGNKARIVLAFRSVKQAA